MTKQQSLATLMGYAETLNADELAPLIAFAKRFADGRAQYGELDLASDGRDFLAEAEAEAIDLVFYANAARIKAERLRAAALKAAE